MTAHHATHCRHGHEIAITGRYLSGSCRECTIQRNRRNRRRLSLNPRPVTKWMAIEPALRAAWEGTSVPTPQLAIQFGLPSKNAVIGLAWRRGWKPRRVPWQRTMADRLDALARAFEAEVPAVPV